VDCREQLYQCAACTEMKEDNAGLRKKNADNTLKAARDETGF
jgi:hypothetical protein